MSKNKRDKAICLDNQRKIEKKCINCEKFFKTNLKGSHLVYYCSNSCSKEFLKITGNRFYRPDFCFWCFQQYPKEKIILNRFYFCSSICRNNYENYKKQSQIPASNFKFEKMKAKVKKYLKNNDPLC